MHAGPSGIWAVIRFFKENSPKYNRYLDLSLLLAGVVIYLVLTSQSTWATPGEGETRRIRYGFTLQNSTNRLLENAEFYAYAPVKLTATQSVTKIEVSEPYELETDEFGNQILHFKISRIPPYGSHIISIIAGLSVSDIPKEISCPDPRCFLVPEKYIEADNAEMIALAKRLKKPQASQTAMNIFQWVGANIKYSGYAPEDRGALYALRNRKGDCSEYMYLFIALCRANGIPARGVGGYVCAKDTILDPNSYHNWAEVFLDGNWYIADPQKNVFKSRDTADYIAFVILKKGRGFERVWSKEGSLKIKAN